MKRMKMLISIGIILLVASSSLYYFTLPPPNPMKVRLGTFGTTMPTLTNSGQRLAQDLGFYEAEGIEVEVLGFESTPVILQALAAGEIDIASVGSVNALLVAANGDIPSKVILGDIGHGAPGLMLLVASNKIATIEDLKGASIAHSSPGDVVQLMTKPVLLDFGIDPEKDVIWVGIGSPPARIAALKAGTVDAFVTSIMTWATLEGDPDMHVLIDTIDMAKFQPPQVSPFIATNDFIEKNPELIQRFVNAIIKTHRHFALDENDWIEAVRNPDRRPDMTPEQLNVIYGSLVWSTNGALNMLDWKKTVDYYLSLPDYKDTPRISESDWVTTQFVDQFLKNEGVFSGMDDPGRNISGLDATPVIVAKEEDR